MLKKELRSSLLKKRRSMPETEWRGKERSPVSQLTKFFSIQNS